MRLRKGQGKLQIVRASESNTSACILWTGGTNTLGYGTTSALGEYLAHRAAYKHRHGSCPPLLRHTCDTPACINPNHLIPGTNADNMADMVSRGRQCKGDDRATKLTSADVLFIRRNHVKGTNRWNPGNTLALSKQFNVCKEYILDIVRRDKWSSTALT